MWVEGALGNGNGTKARYVEGDTAWYIDVDSFPRLTALPATTGYAFGDVVNYNGVLYELVDDGDDPHIFRGTAATRTSPYVGATELEWQLEPADDTNPLQRSLLLKSELGVSPPSTLYIRFTDTRGFATDLSLIHI